jgi:glutamate dehydrogenase
MLRVLVSHADNQKHNAVVEELKASLEKELVRMKWLDEEAIDLGTHRQPFLGIEKAEIIVALCSMLHGPLSKLNPAAYASVPNIIAMVESSDHFVAVAQEIAELFLARFKPSSQKDGKWRSALDEAAFNAKITVLVKKIRAFHAEPVRLLLLRMLHAMQNVKRTNFYNKDRFGLSMRIDPSVMVAPESGKPMPYGVFFVHGRNFNAFHCRFRDIARGGLRIVTPRNHDEYILNSSLQFDEVYGLSYAQQLKNKDIPEGGSKGVIIVNTPSIDPAYKEFAMRKSVKAFADCMFDLMVKDSISGMVDYLNKDELIYLGPDEQVTPWDIDWIVNRAGVRGYPIPAACMSSKAGAGINHKTYGVTSEGVAVYLEEALNTVLNIDPRKQQFTVKITGGPDGDVAGNLLKILFREYGENCKVVGIADGAGVAEDPHGLNSGELLRLVKWSVPITSYDRKYLSKDGILMDNSTNEGLARRNTMPFRVKSDAFVPAGGRPATINKDNWFHFLDDKGKPSSPLIVEGANIFNTPEARDHLFKSGKVVIVKDSSANKCGVITSSYEVQASMILSKDEFLHIKDELVADVVDKLKVHAKKEAALLFRAYNLFPGDMPHFSERISNAINRVTDAVTDALATVNPGDPLFEELRPLLRGTVFLLCPSQ